MFVIEQGMISRALQGQPVFAGGGGAPAPVPQDLDAIVEQLERGANDLAALIGRISDADLEETVQFPTGPGPNGLTIGTWTKRAFAWFMLSDHIHHRGQMSVYLRLAGGKVPAIYGPSGDETWR